MSRNRRLAAAFVALCAGLACLSLSAVAEARAAAGLLEVRVDGGVVRGAVAPHASEIPYVFDTVAARYGKATSRADEAMARAVHAYWIAFARTGRPDPRGLPAWPEYHASTDELMSFTDRGPVAEADPWKQRLDLTERAAARGGH